MDAATLSRAMGGTLSMARYRELLPHFENAMRAANITTINRAAMWCAQIGHESAGLRYMEEIASGAAYEGRRDLGNTQRGDGKRFKGSGPIQLTGRANFTKFSRWCHQRGYVGDAQTFVRSPHLVRENPKWGFLAASWYWTVERPNLNAQSDRRDLHAATRSINGGLNGLADRQQRWNRCLKIGSALLPSKTTPTTGSTAPKKEEEDIVASLNDLKKAIEDSWSVAVNVPSEKVKRTRNQLLIYCFTRSGQAARDALKALNVARAVAKKQGMTDNQLDDIEKKVDQLVDAQKEEE